ncbi:MAG: hypoxanthine phosphoribosyltransferase [Leptospirales bacterium]
MKHLTDLEPEILISAEDIRRRVAELGAQISADYAGESLTLIGALKGCYVFMADLCRGINLPLYIDFIEVSSYGDSTESSGIVKITKDFKHSITDQHVLLIEDIVDTGLTLNYLMDLMATRRPASLSIAALLVKPTKQQLKHPLKYSGFEIEDHFVVGYGMDYQGYYRNLDHVARLDPKTLDRPG